jgi:hypothetical protein
VERWIRKDTVMDYLKVLIRLSREENEEDYDKDHVRIADKPTEILTEYILKTYMLIALALRKKLGF